MYYGNMSDDFVGLTDLGVHHPRPRLPAARGHHYGRVQGRHGNRVLRGLLGFLGAARVRQLPLTVPVPGYAYKRYACKAGGGTRQNQLKAEAYCGQSGFMAHVTSCTPFQYYCDQTLPVRVRKGNKPAPPGLIGGGGISPYPSPYPMGGCPAGYTADPTSGQCLAPEVNGQCPQGAISTIQGPTGPMCVASGGGMLPSPYPTPYPSPYPTPAPSPFYGQPILVPYGQSCPAGYTPGQAAPNGTYCYPSGAAGQCPPGAMFDPMSNSCVSAISGGGAYVGPAPSPYQSYAYGAPPSPYGGPLLTPIDEGGGAATMDMTAYAEAPSAGMPGIPYGYGGPLLTPISEGTQYSEDGSMMNPVPIQQAAGGMPSPMGPTQQSQQCQMEAASPPTADKYGPMTPIKIVCAPAQPVMAQAGGGPMPGVESPDVIAQQEIATMTGLGRWIG